MLWVTHTWSRPVLVSCFFSRLRRVLPDTAHDLSSDLLRGGRAATRSCYKGYKVVLSITDILLCFCVSTQGIPGYIFTISILLYFVCIFVKRYLDG